MYTATNLITQDLCLLIVSVRGSGRFSGLTLNWQNKDLRICLVCNNVHSLFTFSISDDELVVGAVMSDEVQEDDDEDEELIFYEETDQVGKLCPTTLQFKKCYNVPFL